MDFHLRSGLHYFLERLQSRRTALPTDPEVRRRVGAVGLLALAAVMGTWSSRAIQGAAIRAQFRQNRPKSDEVIRWGKMLQFKPVDDFLLAFPPPSDSPGTWWWETPARRLWYIEGPEKRVALSKTPSGSEGRAHRQPKAKKETLGFQRLGEGWEAIPAILGLLELNDSLAATQGRSPRTRQHPHPKEWHF